MRAFWIVAAIVWYCLLPLWPFFWLMSRIDARRCPNCKGKWHSYLVGEWDGEDWHCRNCGQWWTVKNDGTVVEPGIYAD